MERETGIEPATSSLGSWHSTAELLPQSVTDLFRLASRRAEFKGDSNIHGPARQSSDVYSEEEPAGDESAAAGEGWHG